MNRELLTGECPCCDVEFAATGYAAMVKSYNDHLREEHPTRWMRQ